jgi:hypothetical protein
LTTFREVGVRVNSATLELRADSTYILNVDADAMVLGGAFEYPVYNQGKYVRVDKHVTFPLTLDGPAYSVSGEVSKGVLTLTTSDPASPIQSMQLRRRSS